MSDRLRRKEIKEDIRHDGFQDSFDKALAFVARHGKRIVAGIVAFVVLVVGAVAVREWRDARVVKAHEALDQAILAVNAGIDAAAPKPDDPTAPTFADEASRQAEARRRLEGVRDRYSNTTAAAVAGVYLGRILLDEGETAAARQLWEAFLEEEGDDVLAVAVRLSLVQLRLDAGEIEAVVADLRQELESERSSLPEDALLFHLASALEKLDETGEAEELFQRLTEEHPTSAYAREALLRSGGLSALAARG